jgi:hypothetical protein
MCVAGLGGCTPTTPSNPGRIPDATETGSGFTPLTQLFFHLEMFSALSTQLFAKFLDLVFVTSAKRRF